MVSNGCLLHCVHTKHVVMGWDMGPQSCCHHCLSCSCRCIRVQVRGSKGRGNKQGRSSGLDSLALESPG